MSVDLWIHLNAKNVFSVSTQKKTLTGSPPALIREGGSYGGVTRFLEESLGAPAIHFPMGQVRHLHNCS